MSGIFGIIGIAESAPPDTKNAGVKGPSTLQTESLHEQRTAIVYEHSPSNLGSASASQFETSTTTHIFGVKAQPVAKPRSKIDGSTMCRWLASNATFENYTEPYMCSLKVTYPILGFFYDRCTHVERTSTTHSPLLSPPTITSSLAPSRLDPRYLRSVLQLHHQRPRNHADSSTTQMFCCDPNYSNPTSFDAFCDWGNGTDIVADRGNLTAPESHPATGQASCFVSPIIDPKALCVQLQLGEY